MSHTYRQSQTTALPTHYQFRVRGHLGPQWQEWFGCLAINQQPNGDTVISGPLADQAALYGVLKKVRNLGLPLISVNPITPKQTQVGKGEVDNETRQP